MAYYTEYPSNARDFEIAFNNLKTSNIEETRKQLEKIKNDLLEKEKTDFLSKKILETNDKTIKTLDKINDCIDLDVVSVKAIATRLENEKARQIEASKGGVEDAK